MAKAKKTAKPKMKREGKCDEHKKMNGKKMRRDME